MNTAYDYSNTHPTLHENERINKINPIFLLLQDERHGYMQPSLFVTLFFGLKSHKVGNDTFFLGFSLNAFKLILALGGNYHPRWNYNEHSLTILDLIETPL